MSYFRNTADASHLYHPNAAAGSGERFGTAVNGNLADFVKNSTAYRVNPGQTSQVYYQHVVRSDDVAKD